MQAFFPSASSRGKGEGRGREKYLFEAGGDKGTPRKCPIAVYRGDAPRFNASAKEAGSPVREILPAAAAIS